jgi:two-component system osmolarity sensor histidine kinase EnvZ
LQSATLFGRTATAFTLAFLLFSLFSLGLVIYFVTTPLTQRVANDLSALAVLTTQIWVELPPGTRPDFEREMQAHHDISVGLAERTLAVDPEPADYLLDLARALSERTGVGHEILYDADRPEWRWVDIPMGGRLMRVGFDTGRFATGIPLALILMALAGTLIAVVMSLVMVRRITRPLAALAKASTRIGEGRRGDPLPEVGAAELAELTHNFNQMERQLTLLMENRTTLLAGISHDLRTPIARMQLEVELLEGNPDRDLIEGMRADLVEMNEIISATLQLTQGISEEITKQREVCGEVESLVEEFRHREAEIEFKGEAGIFRDLPVTAFRRVLGNLIDNALRYGGERPVRVSCSRQGDKVKIEISDQGPGIPSDQRAIVMQPFKRLEDSRSRASGGSGLGLAIVDQLCRLNEWRFELDEGEQGGTLARLYLT